VPTAFNKLTDTFNLLEKFRNMEPWNMMNSRLQFILVTAISLSFSIISACNSAPATGSERGACYGNGTCDEGLVCASSICVQPSGGMAPANAPVAEAPTPEQQTAPAADPAAAPAAVPAEAPAVAEAPTPIAPAAAPTQEARVQEATSAYAALLMAWNLHNETLYFELIAPTLDCWYSDRDKTRDEVRAGSRGAHFRDRGSARLVMNSFTLLGEHGDRLVFVDDGAVESGSGTRPHRKIIAMANSGSGWQLVGEIGPDERSCPFYASLPPIQPARANGQAETRSCTVSGFHDGCGEGGDCRPSPLDPGNAPLPCGARREDVDRLSERESYESNGEVNADFDRMGRITRLVISYEMANEGAVEWRYVYAD
jgi:hypothetical protein